MNLEIFGSYGKNINTRLVRFRLGVIVISNRTRLQSITDFEEMVIAIDYFCENCKVIAIVIDYNGKVIPIMV